MVEASKTPRPQRMRPPRPVVHGVEWCAADEVPGGVLPPSVEEDQAKSLRHIDDAQGRARVRSSSYYLG